MNYQNFKFEDLKATELTANSQLAECMGIEEVQQLPNMNDGAIVEKLKDIVVSNVLSCFYCNVKFSDSTEQRSHFKLDWHRYNIKNSLVNREPISEDAFLALDEVSSISGSESDTSSDSDSEAATDAGPISSKASGEQRFHASRHAKVFFEGGHKEIWSVYRCLLQSKKESPTPAELLVSAQQLVHNDRKWLIVMLGGGHFAACVFANDKPVLHKTFHCYTVRAKQGGSQSAADNRGGGHAKSAGSSLRRYNEQALVQHVQELMVSWKEEIAKCSLILFRAPGPYNRAVLFGGKSAPLDKSDPRLRGIPFPTRRATMTEVTRVQQMLGCVENYGAADEFTKKFPKSPDKRETTAKQQRVNITSQKSLESFLKEEVKHHHDELLTKEGSSAVEEKEDRKKKKKGRGKCSKQPDPEEVKGSADGTSGSEDMELVAVDTEVDFSHLKDFRDTMQVERKKKRKKPTAKQKARQAEEKLAVEVDEFQKKLVWFVQQGDELGLKDSIMDIIQEQERGMNEAEVGGVSVADEGKPPVPKGVLSREDVLACINNSVHIETQDTLLHVAATLGRSCMVTMLLTLGADPTVRNKKKIPPYNVSADKQTKEAFKKYVADNPGTVDLKKANIPEPLTEEQIMEQEERRKEKRKEKKAKEKIKKKENFERTEEEKEKTRFLNLSDREKCALAAERRLLALQTKNMGTAKAPVLHRCFECGYDITGMVPFEYGVNRFCSVPCLKAHRVKTNSYGVEI